MFYSSKLKEHKSVFGAIKQNQKISYRVFAPYALCVNMLIRKGENTPFTSYSMTTNNDGWFENKTSFCEAGVYFYHFEVIYSRHKHSIFCGEDLSDTTGCRADWQQTVYSEDFEVPDFAKKGVIYQIFPDRFYKGNIEYKKVFSDRETANWGDEPLFANGSVGKVINNDYFGGNFNGIAEKLPYLADLGVTIIYLNPIFEAHSNHRYNTANYLQADPVLGTNDEFKSLCQKAKKFGIAIVLDGVFSHTGADSIYFNKKGRYDSLGAYQSKESPYFSWYKFNEFPDNYVSWWGFDTLPEVQETDESFVEFITGKGGVIDYWMSLGASGFRLDVADELPDCFIKQIRTAVKRNNGVLYGEVWEDASNKVSYGEQRAFLYGNELDSVMNYPFMNFIISFVKGGSGARFMYSVLRICENYPKPALDSLMNLLSTHDTERILTALAGEPALNRGRDWQAQQKMSQNEISNGIKLLKMASVLLYTLPGVPCIYYGDEILTEGYRDPFNRSSFDWNKANDENEMLCWYKTLGKIRKYCPALEGGEFLPVQYEKDFVTFLRVCKEGEIFVAVNPSENPIDIWLLPGWKDDAVIIGNKNENGILKLEPKSVAIIGRGKWVKNII
ncbi:MAG: glycoside hydrolase family 13 protein [Acutalibacteraceae bacterium]